MHCHTCGVCVRGFDHHCIWLGTCIGERNYLAFQVYVAVLNIALPIAAAQTIKAILEMLNTENDIEPLHIVVSCFLSMHALVLVAVNLLVLILLSFHVYILISN